MLDNGTVQTAAHAVKLVGDRVGLAEEGVHTLLGEGVVLGTHDHPQGVHRAGDKLGGDEADVQVLGHAGARKPMTSSFWSLRPWKPPILAFM